MTLPSSSREASETPEHTEPCICCPRQVRGLYAVAFNLLNLRADPDRWNRKIDERLDELQSAVDRLTPFMEAHFAKGTWHSHAADLESAREPKL